MLVQHNENKNISIWCCDRHRGSHQWLRLLQFKVLLGHGLSFSTCSHLLRFEVYGRLHPATEQWFILIVMNPVGINSK